MMNGIASANYRPGGQLLVTGQTTSYASGDDGDLEVGLSRVYTLLDTGQYSGTTAIVLNGKTDSHTNNCVYDHRTRLMWSRGQSASVGPASNGLLPWTTNGSGEGIFAYAAAANAANLGGHSDWRVANITEMYSLLEYDAPSAVPDATYFNVWPAASIFWTGTTDPSNSANALRVNTNSGSGATAVKTGTQYCALVRGPL